MLWLKGSSCLWRHISLSPVPLKSFQARCQKGVRKRGCLRHRPHILKESLWECAHLGWALDQLLPASPSFLSILVCSLWTMILEDANWPVLLESGTLLVLFLLLDVKPNLYLETTHLFSPLIFWP